MSASPLRRDVGMRAPVSSVMPVPTPPRTQRRQQDWADRATLRADAGWAACRTVPSLLVCRIVLSTNALAGWVTVGRARDQGTPWQTVLHCQRETRLRPRPNSSASRGEWPGRCMKDLHSGPTQLTEIIGRADNPASLCSKFLDCMATACDNRLCRASFAEGRRPRSVSSNWC